MVVTASGAVKSAAVRAAVVATCGRRGGSPPPRPPSASPPSLAGGRRDDVRRSEQQAYLGLGWRTAATNEADVYAVDLLTYILGDSSSSRLNQRLREQDRLVFSIEAAYGAWEKAGLTTVLARLDAAILDSSEATILDVIRRVKAEGVTEAERQRAIITAESNYAFDIETAEGLAKTYGQAETTWTLDDELAYLSRLRQVTAVQIQAVARK